MAESDVERAKERLRVHARELDEFGSLGLLSPDLKMLLSDHDRLTRELREARGELHKTHALMLTYKERNIECAGGHDGLGCGLECEVRQ